MREFKLNFDRLRDVIIFPFWECVLKCRHCSVQRPAGEAGFLKCPVTAFHRHIEAEHLRRLTDWNVKYFTILGGEPFLSAALPRMLGILKGKDTMDIDEEAKIELKKLTKTAEISKPLLNSNAKIVVYTNAVLLADRSTSELKKALEDIDYLSISIEGDRYWTEYVRGKVFDRCMSVLEKVRELTKPVIRMSYWYEVHRIRENGKIVEKIQMQDVLRMVDYFNRIEIPVEVAPLLPTPDAVEHLGFTPIPRNIHGWFYTSLSSFPLADNLLPSYKCYLGLKATCPAGWNRLAVDPEGNILACQWDSWKIGHLDWRDEWIESSAERWREQRGMFEPECYGCKLKEVCQSSCRVAMDYKTCPVIEGTVVEKRGEFVNLGFEVRKINRNAAMSLKKMRKLSPGVC